MIDWQERFSNDLEIPCKEYETFTDYGSSSEHQCNLRILNMNIRSYNKNFDNFLSTVNEVFTMFDFVILTEAWLRESEGGENVPNYNFFRTNSKINQNDGVIVYAKCELSVAAQEVELGGVIGLELTFAFRGRPYKILAVYRTHDSDPYCFIDGLSSYYELTPDSRDTTYIFTGDINIDLLHPDSLAEYYLTTLYSSGFLNCVHKATRVSGNSSTNLDHFFVKTNNMSLVKGAVVQTAITDHYPVVLEIGGPRNNTDSQRDSGTFTYINKNKLREFLSRQKWESVINEPEVNDCSTAFFKIINLGLKSSTETIKRRSPRLNNIKPWITTDIVRVIRERDKLSKRLKRQPFNIELKIQFNQLRNNVTNCIKRAKYNYFRNKINQSCGDVKLFWRTLNEISGKTEEKSMFPIKEFISADRHDISDVEVRAVAEGFNQYYTQVGANMASLIQVQTHEPVVDDSLHVCTTRLAFQTVTEEEVRTSVMSLRGGSAPGYCGITASFLKDNIDIFLKPLHKIINRSLAQGVFPEVFKIAKVSPIFKSGSKSDIKNYRPISLLSVFSKVLEKITKKQLTIYLEENNIIDPCQYGFRVNKNISHALFDLNRGLHESINANKKCIIVFLDLAKAFDSLDRTKLLKKLEYLGVRESALDWFVSYLSNRKQFVTLQSKFQSDTMNIDFGVIQGSTLGPVLFLTYINNICKVQTSGRIFLFADDAALLVTGDNWNEVYSRAESDMRKLKLWFDQNTLTLNISKTKCLVVSLRDVAECDQRNIKVHTCNPPQHQTCDCKEISIVTKYKYLGVIIDNKLRWADHINYLNIKIRRLMHFFRRFSEYLTTIEIRTVYCAYVQSLLEGGILAWGGCYRTILEPLLTTQKAIIKVALKLQMRFPSEQTYEEINVLDVRQLYIKNLLAFIHSNFHDIFTVTSHKYSTRHASNQGINTPITNRTFSTTNSFYNAHILFRNVPNYLKDLTSYKVDNYKKKVVEWLRIVGRDGADTLFTSIYK